MVSGDGAERLKRALSVMDTRWKIVNKGAVCCGRRPLKLMVCIGNGNGNELVNALGGLFAWLTWLKSLKAWETFDKKPRVPGPGSSVRSRLGY